MRVLTVGLELSIFRIHDSHSDRAKLMINSVYVQMMLRLVNLRFFVKYKLAHGNDSEQRFKLSTDNVGIHGVAVDKSDGRVRVRNKRPVQVVGKLDRFKSFSRLLP